ncbi:MAG: prepilin-type N-terminal cleavage/methylation domain-containing protein [Candidatus Tectimicrobiota bacterium]
MQLTRALGLERACGVSALPWAVRGLTLVELTVVLAILVILAAVAVRSTEGLLDQTRYEATQQALQNIEDAILGPANQRNTNGSPLITGFVADIGRLPVAVAVGSPAITQPGELVTANGLTLFGFYTASLDPEVMLPGGWRGPYVRLPIGSNELRDGWGNNLVLLKADGSAAAVTEQVSIIRSLGVNNSVGGSNYDADLSTTIEQTINPIQPARHLAFVSLNITPGTPAVPGNNVVVRLYGPVNGNIQPLAQQVYSSALGPQSGVLTAVPIGQRALRAYQTSENPLTLNTPISTASITHRSAVVYMMLPQGGLPQSIDLLLQP